jgi:cell filamentation protein
MTDPSQHRDRYETSGNVESEYVDAEQMVLANLLGLTELHALHLAEEEGLASAYETLLSEIRVDTPLTCSLVQYIHARIFGHLYEWAGRWRTVNISKPGITWPPALFVPKSMDEFERDILRKCRPDQLAGDEEFCASVAEIQGEFLTVHPFREGNARTIKLMTDLLAAQTGRPLLVYDDTDAGRDRYILAASEAFRKNYRPMTEVIHSALAEARKQ